MFIVFSFIKDKYISKVIVNYSIKCYKLYQDICSEMYSMFLVIHLAMLNLKSYIPRFLDVWLNRNQILN